MLWRGQQRDHHAQGLCHRVRLQPTHPEAEKTCRTVARIPAQSLAVVRQLVRLAALVCVSPTYGYACRETAHSDSGACATADCDS